MKILTFIWFLLFCLVGLIHADETIDHDKIKVGKKGSGNDFLLETRDGGFFKKSYEGDWFFSKDGTIQKKLGSGSGSGGGENYNNAFTDAQNANAEDGTTGWTASAGTFDVTTSDPLEGDRSFIWTPAAQNDTLDSPVLNFDRDVFRGRSCQAHFEYKGGDTNLGLQVINGDDEVIGIFRDSNGENKLPAHSITGIESVFFLCPSAADILADADKGNLRFRIINLGVTASALIKFDKNYAGTLIGLAEVVLPDVLSARVNGATAAIISQSSEFIESVVRNSAGSYTFTFKAGIFSVIPGVDITANGTNARIGSTGTITTSGFTAYIFAYNNVGEDFPFTVTVTKQGADAKQSIQGYKPIPKIWENNNEFGGYYDTTTTINGQWPSTWTGAGTVSKSGTGLNTKTINITSMGLTSTPNCVVGNGYSSINDTANYRITGSSATSLQFSTATGGTASDVGFNFSCTKTGVDFKMPTVTPIFAGQVISSWSELNSKNMRVEACSFSQGGGVVSYASTDECGSWLDACGGENSNLRTQCNFKSGIWSGTPICIPQNDINDQNSTVTHQNMIVMYGVNTTSFTVSRHNSNTGSSTNTIPMAHIICFGKR